MLGDRWIPVSGPHPCPLRCSAEYALRHPCGGAHASSHRPSGRSALLWRFPLTGPPTKARSELEELAGVASCELSAAPA
jgi:hypothetical protein